MTTPAIKQLKVRKTDILPPASHLVKGKAVKPLVLGLIPSTYQKRQLVAYNFGSGQFGSKLQKGHLGPCPRTVHNGILNPSAIRDQPTPYWAVVDAMSDHPEGFTRAQILEQATKMVGADKALNVIHAWDVTLNHYRHARRREAALPFMVDRPDSKMYGKMIIRPREAFETVNKFKNIGKRARSPRNITENKGSKS